MLNSEPKLPPNIDRLIDEILQEPPPKLIKGKAGKVNNNGISFFMKL